MMMMFLFVVSRLGYWPRSTAHEWPLSQANRASWGRGKKRITIRFVPSYQQSKVCGEATNKQISRMYVTLFPIFLFSRGASEHSTTIGKVSSTTDRISPSKSASLGRPSRPRTAPPNRAYSKSSRSESAHPVSDIGAIHRKDVTDSASKKQPPPASSSGKWWIWTI